MPRRLLTRWRRTCNRSPLAGSSREYPNTIPTPPAILSRRSAPASGTSALIRESERMHALPLTLIPLKSEPGAARMEYHIAMGVRSNEPEWRRRINVAILKRQADITVILRDYGVPLLNKQGNLASP